LTAAEPCRSDRRVVENDQSMLSEIVSLQRLRMYELACRQYAPRITDEATRSELTKLGDVFTSRLGDLRRDEAKQMELTPAV
jgi:hypothetical protein